MGQLGTTMANTRSDVGIFFAILSLHAMVVMLVKYALVKNFRKATFWQKFAHSMQNMNMPLPFKTWDWEHGTAKDHVRRFKSELLEMLSLMTVNFVFNSLKLWPLFVTGL